MRIHHCLLPTSPSAPTLSYNFKSLPFLFFSVLLLMIPSPVSGSQVCLSGAIHWDIDYLLAAMSSSLSNH